jgi:large conductance mechanosensitive channel
VKLAGAGQEKSSEADKKMTVLSKTVARDGESAHELACRAKTGVFDWLPPNFKKIMFKEFKEFALKGNLIDMAVAFVMGAAFTKLSGSFIEDLVMPLVGKISGGMDYTNKFIALSDKVTATSLAEAKTQGAVLSYGNFIMIALNFVIVAFVMFLVVKAINNAKKLAEKPAAPAAPPEPSAQEKLLAEIRDLLKQKN